MSFAKCWLKNNKQTLVFAVSKKHYLNGTYSLLDMAWEDVNLEVLWAPVALSEWETVTFHWALLPSSAEEHFVDGKRADLCSWSLIHDSVEGFRIWEQSFCSPLEHRLKYTYVVRTVWHRIWQKLWKTFYCVTNLTEPSGPQGTCRVTGIGMALSARRVAIALCASASLRGAFTQVHPR